MLTHVRHPKATFALVSILIVVNGYSQESGSDDNQAPPTFRDSLKSGGEGPEMVVIPQGTFQMGCLTGDNCPDEQLPVHEVSIADFAIGRFEVTFAEYDSFAKATESRMPDDFGWGRELQPVVNVSWDDARKYVAWLSKETGESYRLPSEAEWEYAARADSKTGFSFGNDLSKLCEYANHADSSTEFKWRYTCCSDGVPAKPAKVGLYLANSWGLHDVHGNVWEWVEDCWQENYAEAPVDGKASIREGCVNRVVRSGSFTSNNDMVNSSYRIHSQANYPGHVFGFRVAKSLATATVSN